MSDPAQRPVPVPDEHSAAFWEAAREHRFTVARCAACETLVVAPDDVCAHCGSVEPAFEFEPVSGRGTVRSWAVVHQSLLGGFDVPFIVVDVELAEQADLRVLGRLLDGPDADVHLGADVTVTFEDLPDGFSVPAFVLTDEAGAA